MTRTITWTTRTGKTATVTVSLITSIEDRINADGHVVDVTKPCCEIEVVGSIEGLGVVGRGIPREPRGPLASKVPAGHRIMGKLCVPVAECEMVETAVAEIEASEYVTAWRAKQSAARQVSESCEASSRRVARMMGN